MKKKQKRFKIDLGNGSSVTFPVPNWKSLKFWQALYKSIDKPLRLVKLGAVSILVLMVIGMRDTFIAMDFSPELSGTIVWIFFLFGLVTWGFK